MGNELLVNWRGVEVLGACLWRIVALSSTLREYNTSKILGFEMKNLLLLQVQGGSEITPFLEIFWQKLLAFWASDIDVFHLL